MWDGFTKNGCILLDFKIVSEVSKITHSHDLLQNHNADRDCNGHIYFKSHYALPTYFHCNINVCGQHLRIDNTTRFRYGHADFNILKIWPYVLLRAHGAWRERNNEKHTLHSSQNVHVLNANEIAYLIINPRQWRGGGCNPPMSFSGMAAEPLGGSRWNFA